MGDIYIYNNIIYIYINYIRVANIVSWPILVMPAAAMPFLARTSGRGSRGEARGEAASKTRCDPGAPRCLAK